MRTRFVALAIALVVTGAGCGGASGSGDEPSSIVPASAYLYAEANLDPSGDQEDAARSVVSALPGVGAPARRLQEQFRQLGVPTYTELLIGMPGETYESFVDGVDRVLATGGRPVIYTLLLLNNTHYAKPEIRKAHGLRSKLMPFHSLDMSIRAETSVGHDRLSYDEWLLCVGMMIALTVFMPLYAQVVLGLSVSASSATIVALMGGSTATSILGGRLLIRYAHYKRVPLVGLLLAIAGLAPLALSPTGFSPLVALALLTVVGFGLGPSFPFTVVVVQNAVALHELDIALERVAVL